MNESYYLINTINDNKLKKKLLNENLLLYNNTYI